MTASPAPALIHAGPDHAASETALRLWWAETDPAERARIEAGLWERFGRVATVVVIDMCGFSRDARDDGLIGTLARIGRLRLAVAEATTRHAALAVKFEADNALLAFDRSDAALTAAREAMDVLRGVIDRPIELSVGLDRGRVLLLDGSDLYGDAVNTASRLGEDLARRGEILVTPAAAADLADACGLKRVSLSLGDEPFAAYTDARSGSEPPRGER